MYDFDKIIDRRNTNSLKWEVGENELPMWVADMDFETAPEIKEELKKCVDRGIFGYSIVPEQWYDAVIYWWNKRHNFKMEKEWLQFCSGVVSAVNCVIKRVTNLGDNVLVQTPVYNAFFSCIKNQGRNIVENELTYDGKTYYIDFEDLEKKLSNPLTTMMILCNPQNPSGRIWTKEEMDQIIKICKKYQVKIISDEIHCDLTRKGVKHHPLLTVAPDYKDQIIACTAPSKTFNLAGMQISNIVIPNKEYKAKFDFLLDDCFGLMAAPLGISAMIAAYTHGEEWLDQVREYIDENIAYVHDFLQKNMPEVTMSDTQGTYLIWLDFRAYCNDEKKLEKLMHESAKVALDEGYIFGDEGKGFERINMASPRSMIVECMERIHKALKPEV